MLASVVWFHYVWLEWSITTEMVLNRMHALIKCRVNGYYVMYCLSDFPSGIYYYIQPTLSPKYTGWGFIYAENIKHFNAISIFNIMKPHASLQQNLESLHVCYKLYTPTPACLQHYKLEPHAHTTTTCLIKYSLSRWVDRHIKTN